MNWERIKIQLEHILDTELRFEKLKASEWGHQRNSMEIDHTVFFFLYKQGIDVYTIAVEQVLLTPSERQLMEMTIEAYRSQEKKQTLSTESEEEKKAVVLQDWIHYQLEQGLAHKELPESFASQSMLYTEKVPLLLYGDYSDSKKVTYSELKKLLESFFDAEILLIPLLDKEWLILGSMGLLDASLDEEKGNPNDESVEESLESICSGLHEMMVSEWVGECHLSIYYPMIPAKSLLSTVIRLRESISLGRQYKVGNNIHFPWMLHLEKLLNLVPTIEKSLFIEQILKRIDYVIDAETLMTLGQFFELECNVSETAKRLYIHRNTLLYRLDKFKQETGFDVRVFSHAVLVRIALLLYKVTKRK